VVAVLVVVVLQLKVKIINMALIIYFIEIELKQKYTQLTCLLVNEMLNKRNTFIFYIQLTLN